MADNQTIKDRLNSLLLEIKVGKTDFAETIGVDGGQWGKVLSGKMNPTLKQILEITSTYNVRAGWLLEGEGPMFSKEKSGTKPVPDQIVYRIKESLSNVRASFDELSSLLDGSFGLGTNVDPDATENLEGKKKNTGKK